MNIVLRDYQEEVIDIIMSAMPVDSEILISAATGCGKTIIFCELIKRLLSKWTIRICIVAHRRELIFQAGDKLKNIWAEAPIGYACASFDAKKDLNQPITIGSIQTLIGLTNETAPFDLIIIDEAHHVPELEATKSQYIRWIDIMRQYNPKVRVLGFTATPFRLGHGYCHGDKCKPGNTNFFFKLHHRISIKQLQSKGYLCPYRAKHAADIELKNIKKSAGEYNLLDLSNEMSKPIHIGSAISAVKDYAHGRTHILVFGCTIDHAEKLHEAFQESGEISGVVHSQLSLQDRDMTLELFRTGKIRVLINVMVMSEGVDFPEIDCVLMCRPTLSPSLYVQQIGRGLRILPDKNDVLILDLSGNCLEHGDPDNPKVIVPNPQKKEDDKIKDFKECPDCREVLPLNMRQCPICGYIWQTNTVIENSRYKFKDIDFDKKEKSKYILYVTFSSMERFTSKKGNLMSKISIMGDFDKDSLQDKISVNHFFMFDLDAHPYALKRSRSDWVLICKTRPPESTDEAINRRNEFLFAMPSQIEIEKDGKWWRVTNWNPTIEYEDEVPF